MSEREYERLYDFLKKSCHRSKMFKSRVSFTVEPKRTFALCEPLRLFANDLEALFDAIQAEREAEKARKSGN